MKKILILLSVLMLFSASLFADGSITSSNDKTLKIETTQSGDILIKSGDYVISMKPNDREIFIYYLKAHLESLNKFSSSSIKVKNSSYTNRILLNGQKQYRFELIVNEIENFPYVLSIRLYDSDDKKESYTFDIAKLNEFISLIEATRENSNAMNSQNAIVREEVSKLRSMH